MKKTYDMDFVDGRCYFKDENGRWSLVDTGYGATVSTNGDIGGFHTCIISEKELRSFNPTIMPDGNFIDGILCPVSPIAGYNVLIGRKQVEISQNEPFQTPAHRWFIPFTHQFLPIVECEVDGVKKKLFFDSGMRLAAIDDDKLVEGKAMQGKQVEWIGIMEGLFDAPLYNATFSFGNGFSWNGMFEHDYLHRYVSRFGRWGIDGFIGMEFHREFDMLISTAPGRNGIYLI